MRVGLLTGGGDCPGLNAVIRAVVRKGEMVYDDEIIGFLDAWDGVLDRRTMSLDVHSMRGMLPKGGTLLGTRRGSPYDRPDGLEMVASTFRDMQLDALIVVGGNGSLTVASNLHHDLGLPIIGVPKTIDNDVVGTDTTFGFNTAVQIATDAIDRLHTTAESHDRVIVVEVMGRDSGWIATHAGIAGGATVILIPELKSSALATSAVVMRRLWWLPRGPSRSLERCPRKRRCMTCLVTCAAVAWPIVSLPRSRDERASRRVWYCWATSSVAERHPRSIECSPRGTVSPLSMQCTRVPGVR
jgi:6-phosphofructokinase